MFSKSIEQLVEEALDSFDNPNENVASHVRRVIRIATKRQDYPTLIRILPETFDLTVGGRIDHPAFMDARQNLIALLGADEGEQEIDRLITQQHRDRTSSADKNKIYGASIAQIERNLSEIQELINSLQKTPEGLTPIDTYFVAKQNDQSIAGLLPSQRALGDIVERVRQSVYDVLLATERSIELGQRRPTVFERGQEYVQAALARRAPSALERFNAAEAAISDGSPESLAHALTSCRRMIKALADALYPATNQSIVGADGKGREMTDDAYRNRLMQYAIERLGGQTQGKLI